MSNSVSGSALKMDTREQVNLAFELEDRRDGDEKNKINSATHARKADGLLFNGIGDIALAVQKTPRQKAGRHGYTAGGLLYGEQGYFQHPYGNTENFLTELQSNKEISDKADIESRSSSGKLFIWVAFCLFTLGVAGVIIFGAETSSKRHRTFELANVPPTSNLSRIGGNVSHNALH